MKAKFIPRALITMVLALFMSTFVLAQEKTVTGTVVEEGSNEAIPGVTVIVKGTTSGTITDADGKFTLQAADTDVLVFSYIGYVSAEQLVGSASSINIALKASDVGLEEVVVIGYGTVKKKDATGALSSLKEDDFNKGVSSSPSQLLQGKASGVLVTNSSGDPGANSSIRIRGNSSVRAGNEPLIVVDGVPLGGGTTQASSDDVPGGIGSISARNPLNFINPNDIASIDVLKDASATAIYGSRGANGVIIVTTKQGVSGENAIEYSASLSIGSIANKIKVYNASEFAAIAPTQALGADENALDEILRNSISQRHNLVFRNGSKNLKYRLSLGMEDQQGIIKNSGMKKYTANLNITQKLFDDRLTLAANMITSQVDDEYVPVGTSSGFEGSLVSNALTWNPTRPLYTSDGDFTQFSFSDGNPMAGLHYINDEANTLRVLANFSAALELVEGLTYKMNLGVDRYNSERATELSGLLMLQDVQGTGYARLTNQRGSSLLLEHTLTYNKVFGDYSFTALGGYSYQVFDRSEKFIEGKGFETDDVSYIDQLQSISQDQMEVGSSKDPSNELQSFFGRVNFSMFNKILATVTFRADGSSKFGENNKYGYFPSVALAYRLSEESFIPDLFDDLKIRAGWGQTGNQEFPAGASQAQYEIKQDAIERSQYDNPDLKWETSVTYNFGLDFSVLQGRLSGTIEYFNKSTKDLLFNAEAALPGPSGIRRWTNLDANVVNKGVELALNATLISTSDFSLSLGGNVSFLKNTLEDFSGVVETGRLHGQGLSGVTVQRFVEGQPLHVFYTLDFMGLDADGNGIYSDTKKYLGDPNPSTLLGINSTITYKNFDLVMNFNGAFGHMVYNNTGTSILVVSNPSKGRNTSPDYTLPGESVDNTLTGSSRYLEKGDFFRLNNLTVSYTVLKAPLFFDKMRFSLTGQNLFVITNFTGFDPEVNVDKSENGVPSFGIEYAPYPSARTFTFGINLTF